MRTTPLFDLAGIGEGLAGAGGDHGADFIECSCCVAVRAWAVSRQ